MLRLSIDTVKGVADQKQYSRHLGKSKKSETALVIFWVLLYIVEILQYCKRLANQNQHLWHLSTHDILSTSLHGRDTTILQKGWLIRNSRYSWHLDKSKKFSTRTFVAHCVCRVIYLLGRSLQTNKMFFLFFPLFVVCRFCTSKRSFGYFFLWLAMQLFVAVFVQ